jgi:zinc finger protein DZIP1
MNVDLDKVQKEIDLSTLEALLNNVTYANLDREDLERLGDAHFVKLFRISQLTIEYLLYTQDYFQSVNKVLDKKGKEWYEAAKELESKLKSKHEDLKSLKKELKIKKAPLINISLTLSLNKKE